MTLTIFGSFAVLLILGVPISFALGIAAVFAILVGTSTPLMIGVQMMFSAVDSFPMMAIPFFLLAGNIMSKGGISKRLINFASVIVGGFTGGLALVSIFSSIFFAAISGSSPATTAAIGSIMVPEMNKSGYDNDFSSAVVSAAGTVGVVIPPSIPMVLYAVLAGVSIGEMFISGFGPGIAMGLVMMVVAYSISKKRGYKGEKRSTLIEAITIFIDSFWALLMPIIILGGIYGGIFTPTEAAAVAVVYGLIVGFFVYKELSLKALPDILFDSAVGTATIMLLIATANIFGWLLVSQQIPQKIAAGMLSITTNPALLLLLYNIILIIVGTFLNTTAAVVLLTPILIPVLTSVGIDPVFAGIIMVVNLAVGMITPPVGLCLFVGCNIGGISLEAMTKAILPFLAGLIMVIFLITYFPPIVTFIPSLLGK